MESDNGCGDESDPDINSGLDKDTIYESQQRREQQISWLLDDQDAQNIPDESTEEHPSLAKILTTKAGEIKTPFMFKLNRVVQPGTTVENTANKYCMPVLAQATPCGDSGFVDDKNFSFFNYVSKREYIKDSNWGAKDSYFKEMLTSLNYARMASSATRSGQVSPTVSPVKQKNRLSSRPSSDKVIMLDLDETLVRAEPYKFGVSYDDVITVSIGDGNEQSFGLFIRPFTEEFLQIIAKEHRLIVYTASVRDYAEKVVHCLDPEKKYIEQVLSREHCSFINGMFIKNLAIAAQYGVKEDNVIIIDNYIHSYALHPELGIPIKPFYGSKVDRELVDLANYLYLTSDYPTLREFLTTRFDFPRMYDFLENNRNMLSS